MMHYAVWSLLIISLKTKYVIKYNKIISYENMFHVPHMMYCVDFILDFTENKIEENKWNEKKRKEKILEQKHFPEFNITSNLFWTN